MFTAAFKYYIVLGNFAAAPNNILEGYSSAMYVLDLVQERWTLIVTDDDSLIPTPRDKMAGWCYRKKLEFCIILSSLLSFMRLFMWRIDF